MLHLIDLDGLARVIDEFIQLLLVGDSSCRVYRPRSNLVQLSDLVEPPDASLAHTRSIKTKKAIRRIRRIVLDDGF